MLGNKIHFTSLGCARNLVDSEVMLGILLKAGYEATDKIDEADYLIVNTCGFLEISRQESCNAIEELFQVKKSEAKIVVTGCMVQKNHEELRKKFPKVHYFLGSGDVEKVLEAIETPEAGAAVTSARSYLEWGEIPRRISTPSHYAYLKIAEGCAKRCSFCIIPTIKGPLRSKSIEQVLKEFNLLLNQGVKEVILIAQDLGDYAKERKEKDGLENLIREMLKVKKDFWLRFLYLYPDEISEELMDLIEGDPRICRYLDMPIQHINDEILKSMRRKTSRAQIIETIVKLRERFTDIVIRTSLMVGYPGETDEKFKELLDFVKKYTLDNVGIFKFSAEKGAAASRLTDQVPEEIKEERFNTLVKAQLQIIKKRNRKYIGKKLATIVEGYHPESDLLMRGRFFGQCPEIDGQIVINDGRKVAAFGKLYEVEITDVADHDLIGRVLRPLSEEPKRLGAKLALVAHE